MSDCDTQKSLAIVDYVGAVRGPIGMDRRLKPILLIEYPAASQEPTTDPRKIQDPKES